MSKKQKKYFKYLGHISKLRNYLINTKYGLQISGPEILLLKYKRGRCNYDICPRKSEASDIRIVTIYNSDTKKEIISMENYHSSCLEKILGDSGILDIN